MKDTKYSKRELKGVFNTPKNLVDIQRVHNIFKQIEHTVDHDTWMVDQQGLENWFDNFDSLVIYYNYETNTIQWETEYMFIDVFDDLKIDFEDFLNLDTQQVNLKIRYFQY